MNKTLWIGIGILIAIVIIAGYFAFGRSASYQTPTSSPSEIATTPAPSGSPAAQTGVAKKFTIQAKEFSLTPSTISVNQGDSVTITFKNSGTISHNLTIPDLNMATNTIAPGQTDTLSFTASQTGTFVFYCSVDGHRDMGMQGTLEIK